MSRVAYRLCTVGYLHSPITCHHTHAGCLPHQVAPHVFHRQGVLIPNVQGVDQSAPVGDVRFLVARSRFQVFFQRLLGRESLGTLLALEVLCRSMRSPDVLRSGAPRGECDPAHVAQVARRSCQPRVSLGHVVHQDGAVATELVAKLTSR